MSCVGFGVDVDFICIYVEEEEAWWVSGVRRDIQPHARSADSERGRDRKRPLFSWQKQCGRVQRQYYRQMCSFKLLDLMSFAV